MLRTHLGTHYPKRPLFYIRLHFKSDIWLEISIFERGDEAEGFLLVTAAADKRRVDIHDRRPLVLPPKAARAWIRQDAEGKEASVIAADGSVPADKFIWHAVTRADGNVENQGPELIEAIR